VSGRPGEEALIARFFAPLATEPGALGLTDDAATLAVPEGEELVLTTDMLVCGGHFFPDDPPDLVAKKALRVNLSDLAAKGARPRGYLLSLALPESWTVDWLDAFARGLGEDQAAFSCPLLGGDTTKALGPLVISVTAVGTLPKGTAVRRTGARPGDVVVVSGTIGDGALGCRLLYEPAAGEGLEAAHLAHLHDRYRLPCPRVALAEAVRAAASASMDVSDGLIGDLAKLCRASGVSAEIEIARVPLSDAAKALIAMRPDLSETALTGGDDYEILATVPPDALGRLGIAVTPIGRIVAGDGAVRAVENGRPLAFRRASFSHF
jgi:thiamine-monophosphate kinase